MINHPEQNLPGSEKPGKKKFKQVKNSWIDVSNYRPDVRHKLLVDDGAGFYLAFITNDYETKGRFLHRDSNNFIIDVKRVMILSRK